METFQKNYLSYQWLWMDYGGDVRARDRSLSYMQSGPAPFDPWMTGPLRVTDLHEDQAQDALVRPVVEKTPTL
ncbi:hypothetical protein TNCV_1227621 [Trichonephila clavipes]|nr:hypothetical protein TNCV_1227621 [Trichonephila clavipes]